MKNNISIKFRDFIYGITLDEIILILIFYLSPFFDAITGFLVLNGIMSEGALATPSQLGKFLTVFLLFIQILKNGDKNTICITAFFSAYIIILEFIFCLYYKTPIYGLLYGFVQLYKVLYLILCFFFLKKLLVKKQISAIDLIKFIVKSAINYSIILLVTTLLGINTSTYASGTFGSKGVFASGNGLSIYLGFSSFIAAFYYFNCNRTIKNLISFLLIWICGTIVGTKASIVFLFINIIVILFYSKTRYRILILFFIVFSFTFLLDRFSTIFDVIIYRFNHADNIYVFLASGRDGYRDNAFKLYDTSGIKAMRIFFGSGAFVSFRTNLSDMKVFDTLERDLYDVFFMYGLNMLFIYLLFLVRYFFYGFLHNKKYFSIGFACVAGYSLLAGHTLFNSMSGLGLVFFPLLIRFWNYDKKVNTY